MKDGAGAPGREGNDTRARCADQRSSATHPHRIVPTATSTPVPGLKSVYPRTTSART